MANPTLAAAYVVSSGGKNTSALTTPSFTPAANEVIVVIAFTEDSTFSLGAISGGSLTYTSRRSDNTASNASCFAWTAVVGSSPSAMTVSVAGGVAASNHCMFVFRWTSATLGASPNMGTATTNTACSATLAGATAGSAVAWASADWNGVAPGTPTYRSSATQAGAPYTVASTITAYGASQSVTTGGTQTFGVSAPTGQQASMFGIEILGTGGGGSSTITRVGEAATKISGTGTGTAITTALPAGVAANDVLILEVGDGLDPTAITTPAGWTLQRRTVDAGTAPAEAAISAFWKAAGSSETAPSLTASVATRWHTLIRAFRGVDNTNPFITENGIAEAGASTTTVHSAPALTNTDAGAWGIFSVCSRQVATPYTFTPGTGLTERVDQDTGVASTTNTAFEASDTNGPVATGSVTYSATGSAGSGIAAMWAALLRPASTGGASVAAAASVSGALTVTAAASAIAVPVAAAISGAMTVSAAAVQTVKPAASVSGGMTVTAGASAAVPVAAAVSGSLAVTAAAKATVPAAATVSGTLSVAASAGQQQLAAAAVSAALTVSAVSSVTVPVASSVSGALAVTAAAKASVTAAAAVAGQLIVSASVTAKTVQLAVSVTAALTVSAVARQDIRATVQITGTLTITIVDLVSFAYTTSTAVGGLIRVPQMHGNALTVASSPSILITVTQAALSTAFGTASATAVKLMRVIENSSRGSALGLATTPDPLGRVRFLNGLAAALATASAVKLHVVTLFRGNTAAGRSAAGEKPSRIVITTGEGDATATLIGGTDVKIVQGYAEGDATMTGNLIVGAKYSVALVTATARGNLKPVRHLDQVLHATASAPQAILIRAAKMTDVVSVLSEGSLFPPSMGLKRSRLAEELPSDAPTEVEPPVFARVFMVPRP